jgi:hypothetical protein
LAKYREIVEWFNQILNWIIRTLLTKSLASFHVMKTMIYGRGPTPAGMAMVPMILPDGRIGHVL